MRNFKKIKKYLESPFAKEIIQKFNQKGKDEIGETKERARNIINQLLKMEVWGEDQERTAVKAAITLAAGKHVTKKRYENRIGRIEKEILTETKKIQTEIEDTTPLVHPDFVYTKFMTDNTNIIEEANKRHEEIKSKKHQLMEKIREKDLHEYSRIRNMTDDLNNLLRIKVSNRKKEDMFLISKVQARVRDISRYIG